MTVIVMLASALISLCLNLFYFLKPEDPVSNWISAAHPVCCLLWVGSRNFHCSGNKRALLIVWQRETLVCLFVPKWIRWESFDRILQDCRSLHTLMKSGLQLWTLKAMTKLFFLLHLGVKRSYEFLCSGILLMNIRDRCFDEYVNMHLIIKTWICLHELCNSSRYDYLYCIQYKRLL